MDVKKLQHTGIEKLDTFLQRRGFERCKNDFCLYTKDNINI